MFTIYAVGGNKVSGVYKLNAGGKSRILRSYSLYVGGRSRLENAALEGYCVHIGVDAVPDLSVISQFSATLPISIAVTPPVSGTSKINVLVRKRNSYGLFSLNQKPYSFVIDSSGDLVNEEISPPTGIMAVVFDLAQIRVLGNYTNLKTDLYPSDLFRVWVGSSPPDVEVDIFDYEGTITDMNFGVVMPDTYSPGIYHVAVCLYRSSDGVQSAPLTTTVEVPTVPSSVSFL